MVGTEELRHALTTDNEDTVPAGSSATITATQGRKQRDEAETEAPESQVLLTGAGTTVDLRPGWRAVMEEQQQLPWPPAPAPPVPLCAPLLAEPSQKPRGPLTWELELWYTQREGRGLRANKHRWPWGTVGSLEESIQDKEWQSLSESITVKHLALDMTQSPSDHTLLTPEIFTSWNSSNELLLKNNNNNNKITQNPSSWWHGEAWNTSFL